MKKIFLLCLLALLTVGCCRFGSFCKELDFSVPCNTADDCVIVPAKGCCGCASVISKTHLDIWNDMYVPSCPGALCEPCRPPGIPVCVNNHCSMDYS